MTETESGSLPATDAVASETEVVTSVTDPVESSPTETTTPDDAGQQPQPHKRTPGEQKRIDELTWGKNEAIREFDRERQEKEYWRELAQRQQAQQAKPPAPVVTAPNPNDFYDNPQGYLEAQQSFIDAQVDARLEARLAERDATKVAQERNQKYESRAADFARKAPDFADKVNDRYLPVSPVMAEYIKDSVNGPELLYWVANNRETAQSIYWLPPHIAAGEMGKVEDRLESAKRRPVIPPVSKAPPPPPTIEADAPPEERDVAKMSDPEFAKWRRKQIAQRR